MTDFHMPHSFAQINSSTDPWLIKQDNGWYKGSVNSHPSLFDTDDEQQWSPQDTPPSSPPNISAIKKSLIQAQKYLSTASPIDPWTVNQLSELSLDDDEDKEHLHHNNGQNLYKTELCRSFMETNTCRYGIKCQFAHGRHEIRVVSRHPKYKTEICKTFHNLGTCPYGIRCRFIHKPKNEQHTLDTSFSSNESSANSSPMYTPPDSPTLTSSSSPPEVLQWSSSWSPIERALPALEDTQPPASPDPSTRRLPIFRNLSASNLHAY